MTLNREQPTITDELPTREGYDRWSTDYDDDGNPLIELETPHVARLLGPVAGLDVGDIGCGTGRHALRLAAEGARVTAVDFSAGMLRVAQDKPGAEQVQFVQHDLHEPLPFEEHRFDRVLNCLVLDHIRDPAALFREMHRVLRPNGVAVISVMHPAMNLVGSQARFVDPDSGGRVNVESVYHQVSDYVRAAVQADLAIDCIDEHCVTAELAQSKPRAEKYLGWPMLLMMRLTR